MIKLKVDITDLLNVKLYYVIVVRGKSPKLLVTRLYYKSQKWLRVGCSFIVCLRVRDHYVSIGSNVLIIHTLVLSGT